MKVDKINLENRRILSEIELLFVKTGNGSGRTVYEVVSEDKTGQCWSDWHSVLAFKYMGVKP